MMKKPPVVRLLTARHIAKEVAAELKRSAHLEAVIDGAEPQGVWVHVPLADRVDRKTRDEVAELMQRAHDAVVMRYRPLFEKLAFIGKNVTTGTFHFPEAGVLPPHEFHATTSKGYRIVNELAQEPSDIVFRPLGRKKRY